MADALHDLLLRFPHVPARAEILHRAAQADEYDLFGLVPADKVDPAALRRRFLALSRVTHPDAAASEDPSVQRDMAALSARVNQAYETLRDPILRAESLLTRAGGPSAAEDKRVPPELLAELLEVREELDAAHAAGDAAAMALILDDIASRHDAERDRAMDLAARLAAGDASLRDALRLSLNALRYLATVRSQGRALQSSP